MNSKIKSIEQIENGNFIFSYKNEKYNYLSPIFLISLIIFITLPLCAFLIYLWDRKRLSKDIKIEELVVNQCLENYIIGDIDKYNKKYIVIYRKYFHDDNNSTTIRYLSVLLSNGIQLKYNVINEVNFDSTTLLEIDIKAEISK